MARFWAGELHARKASHVSSDHTNILEGSTTVEEIRATTCRCTPHPLHNGMDIVSALPLYFLLKTDLLA